MSHTRAPLRSGARDARSVEEQHVADRHEEDETGGTRGSGRRWYHLRPEPPGRADLMGFNSTWWMAVGWLILILLVVFPFPFWSW